MEIHLNRSRFMNGTDLDRGASHRSRSRTMDTTIYQQVAMDDALVPHAKRLSIGRSNFCLLSNIKSKESTLQLVYDVMRMCLFFKAFLVKHKVSKKSNEMYYPRFTKVIIHHFMSKDPSIPRRNKVNWHYVRDDYMFSTIKLVSRQQNTQQFGALLPIKLTNEDIGNSNAYKEYYAVATGATPPKPKASVRKTRTSFDTTITPLTAAAGPRLTTSQKGKQAAKASKAKSLSALSEGFLMYLLMSLRKNYLGILLMRMVMLMKRMTEVERDVEKEDEEEGGDDEQEYDEEEFLHGEEEPRDEESLDPILKTPEDTKDEGNGKEDLGLNVGREEGYDEEEEEDELYTDVNINHGRGIQTTEEVEDSHVTLTLRNLYKALVEAYEYDKIILDTYEDTVTLKRRRDDDADKDKEPSSRPDQGSKRRRERKEPESASAPTKTTTRSAGRTMWIEEPIGYDKHALYGVSHWGRKRQQFCGFAVNWESARDVYSKRRIIAITELKIVEWHNYKHLDWITVRRDDDELYKIKEGDFKRLCIQDIEDMLLLLVQGKLTNLTVEERFAFNNNDKKNRLMRIDELHKFSDGTLTDVRTALDDRLKGIRMLYFPQSIWRKSDKDRAAAMIQAIDKRLKTRRIMKSLERSISEYMGIVPTEMELILEHTQQGISHEVLVTPTKPGRMTKPYSSHYFIAKCFNAGNLKMEVKNFEKDESKSYQDIQSRKIRVEMDHLVVEHVIVVVSRQHPLKCLK
uniref:Uncharacterized protein n=1 Tax=Tanacetum cinerariifolium TaxID=118510 RepID=A0A6L2M7C3_TANCI|nr:hypothetical protein [Tanacetum cinerariifolium]